METFITDYRGGVVNYFIYCLKYLFQLCARWEYLLHDLLTGFLITCFVGHGICLRLQQHLHCLNYFQFIDICFSPSFPTMLLHSTAGSYVLLVSIEIYF